MAEIWFENCAQPGPSSELGYNDLYYGWEDDSVRERTGHPLTYAEPKKMKSHFMPMVAIQASLKGCSSLLRSSLGQYCFLGNEIIPGVHA
jgi:hypothetical protein